MTQHIHPIIWEFLSEDFLMAYKKDSRQPGEQSRHRASWGGGGGDESAALATAAATEVLGWGYFTPSGKQLYHLSLRARCMSRTS